MSLEALHLAWLFLLLPALAIFFRLAVAMKNKRAERFAQGALYERLEEGISRRKQRLKPPLVLAAVGALILALLDPRWGSRLEEVSRRGIDLMVAIDTSRSMLADDLRPNRLEKSKLAVQDLVQMLRGDRIGLIPFAGTAHVYCPLTLDYRVFLLFLSDVTAQTIPKGGTNIAAAIDKAVDAFALSGRRHRALIIFTDGENLEGDLDHALARAKENEMRIFTIGFGSPEGVPIRVTGPEGSSYLRDAEGNVVVTRLDESTLQRIALATGGAYHRATPGGGELELIYRERIARMEQDRLEEALRQVHLHRFQWPLALAVILLFVEGAMGENKSQRFFLPFFRRLKHGNKVLAFLSIAGISLLNLGMGSPAGRRVREGNRFFQQEKFQEAQESYQQARAARPDAPEILYNLGNIHYRLSEFPQAEGLYKRSSLDFGPGRRALASYNLGNTFYREKRLGSALEAYREAIRLDPKDLDAKYNYELVMRAMEKEEAPKPKEQEEEKPDQPEEQPPPEGDENEQEPPVNQDERPKPQEENFSPEDIERLLDILLTEEEDVARPLPAEKLQYPPPLKDW